MQASTSKKCSLIIREGSESAKPTECSFSHPVTQRQDKPLFPFRVLHDFQFDGVIARLLSRILAGIALIHKHNLHGSARHLLHLLGHSSTWARFRFCFLHYWGIGGNKIIRPSFADFH